MYLSNQDERYAANEKNYDWYLDYNHVQSYLSKYLQPAPDFEILIPGCGNSMLSSDLYDNGYYNITSIDLSAVVVSQMCDRFKEKDEMEFSVMDARKMDLIPNNCFDVIIDKG